MTKGAKQRNDDASAPVWETDPATGKTIIRPRKGLLERQPKIVSRVAAFDKLHIELAIATEVFLHEGDGGRQGVHDATCALIEYLTSQGIPYAALEAITAVQTAIVDADHGRESLIFAPRRGRKGGKPRDSDMTRAFDGKIAIVMECCVEHFRQARARPFVQPAAELAAKLINQSSWPVRVTAKEMVERRERIQQASADSMDRVYVDAVFKSGLAKRHPLKVAEYLLHNEGVNPLPKNSE